MTQAEWEVIEGILSSYKRQFMALYPINDKNRSPENSNRLVAIMHNAKNYINSIDELQELYYYNVNSGTARYMAEGFLIEASDFDGAISSLISKVRNKIEE